MKVREAIAAAGARLAAASATPRLDAELLMAHALGLEREELLLSGLDREPPDAFAALVSRREAGEPVAYILGRRAFWTIELEVAPGVLVPRPDSETLLEAAVDRFGAFSPASVLDLGTGPGTLLLAALDQWPHARGLGIDRSPRAIELAARNADRLGLGGRAEFRLGDWGGGLDRRFDLILCNPPYVEDGAVLPVDVAGWEPAEALYAGSDGLDAYRRLAPQLPGLLAPQGVACVEIGAGQEGRARRIFEAEGLRVATRQDLAGLPRCLILEP
jgi:release factor glutamine methyltransferase